jgi:hypothetical protein
MSIYMCNRKTAKASWAFRDNSTDNGIGSQYIASLTRHKTDGPGPASSPNERSLGDWRANYVEDRDFGILSAP